MTKQPKGALIVGLTGNIGSGKSEVARILERLGAHIIDADVLAREVVAPKSKAINEIAKTFGENFITKTGELDRKALGKIVFSDPKKKKELETILHPKIRELFLSLLNKASNRYPIVVYVVPLLFESGYEYKELDKIILVTSPKEVSIERTIARDHCSRELALKKYDSQIPPEEKLEQVDFVIDNDSNLEALNDKTTRLYNDLIKLQPDKISG